MPNISTICASRPVSEPLVRPEDIAVPQCEKGIGLPVLTIGSDRLIDGVGIDVQAVWPDDRGHFMEVLRVGQGLAAGFPTATSQVSATLTRSNVIKAFHYHLHQYDYWTVVDGMLQVALVDLRKGSRTFGQRNTFYVGTMRPWQVLIPPGVAHGYKVVSVDPAMLVYVTSRFYNPSDELRLPYNDPRLAYDWDTQFK